MRRVILQNRKFAPQEMQEKQFDLTNITVLHCAKLIQLNVHNRAYKQ